MPSIEPVAGTIRKAARRDSARRKSRVEPIAGISLNEYICVYGRGSNVRQCTAKVADTSMSCDNIGHLVEMNAHITVGGDSGGPWSLYNTAYGSHVGACDGGGSVFTPADYFDEAINVRVATT